MRIHRTRHDRDFTVVPNRTARNRKLSFTARGLWLHLISLPNGAKEDVRTLADNNPGVGRKGVANALDELVAQGYYFRFTIRDPETGRVWTETALHDLPQTEDSPAPASPGTGDLAPGHAGAPLSGERISSKKQGKIPPFPPVVEPAQVAASAVREGSSEKQDNQTPQLVEAARIVRRFAAVDSRLNLSERQAAKLAPSVADWLDRGATIGEITDAVTQGLPSKVYSAARLIEDRLDRKRPERKRQWKQYADCAERCGNLLPAGQDTGICTECALGTAAYFEIDCTTGEIADAPEAPALDAPGPLAPQGLAVFRAARAAMA
ncbi:hypothetical protein ACTVZO_16370 [Streptomyces sp. IBSNAI002]|uniref:hypothetical protein n=1 Tax=Streptomyces sp. IBSNAI002 TaxID=3457500 RepID=UPI003FD534CF